MKTAERTEEDPLPPNRNSRIECRRNNDEMIGISKRHPIETDDLEESKMERNTKSVRTSMNQKEKSI